MDRSADARAGAARRSAFADSARLPRFGDRASGRYFGPCRAAAMGPVYALIRPLFDATVRGMWLGSCANDDELELFETDKLGQKKSFTNLVDELETKLGHSGGVLSKLRKTSWSILSDLTHTGFKHILRRNSETHTGPHYPAQETEQVLRLAAGLGLFAATAMADMAGNRQLAQACLARAREFAATAPGNVGRV
jgi:hypothetical protein